MSTKLTISFTDDLLKTLKKQKSLKLSLAGGRNGRVAPALGKRLGRPAGKGPRPGSHRAKVLEWAKGRKGTFSTDDVRKFLKVSRAHASMILSKLVADRALRREGRGSYRVK